MRFFTGLLLSFIKMRSPVVSCSALPCLAEVIGAFFLLFSVCLQSALHLNDLTAGLLFLPFGDDFLTGTLLTPYLRRFVGNFMGAIGMECEAAGLAGLAWLTGDTLMGNSPAMLPLLNSE